MIIISSVGPAPTSAASLTMYRHLVENPGFDISRFPVKLTELWPRSILARIFARARNNLRLHRLMVDLETLIYAWLPLHRRYPLPGPDAEAVVLTLAHGAGHHLARRYALRHGLPLVVRFDDWWPDVLVIHRPLRPLAVRAFAKLYRDADCAICISDGMRQALGPHPNARVILPMARIADTAPPLAADRTDLRVCYLGNMVDYAPMLGSLIEELNSTEIGTDIRLEFRGHEPRWPLKLKERLRSEGRLHDFETGPAFETWFDSFDVYLVTMFFEAAQRRRVETCFATKLVEYSALARPIMIWAPEYADVVRWARRTGAAVCVTDPAPGAVVKALGELADDPNRRARLGRAAREAYETDFDPVRLQRAFVSAMDSVKVLR